MGIISENTIKKVMIRYLRHYYKDRPRTGKTHVILDWENPDGIIVDGSISFQTEEGKKFLATFEATSYFTKNEVVYRYDTRILVWHSVMFSFVTTAALLLVNLSVNVLNMDKIGLWSTLVIIMGMLVLLAMFFGVILNRRHEYRYVYAVEQFKRYFADDQWIAVGEDVFPDVTDKHYKELKRQCVYNGFGLVEISNDKKAALIIAPARVDVFEGKRKELRIPMTKLSENLILGKNKFGKKMGLNLLRYRQGIGTELFIIALSTMFIGAVFYKMMENRELKRVDESKYWTEVFTKIDTLPEEGRAFLEESDVIKLPEEKLDVYTPVTVKGQGEVEEQGEIIIGIENNQLAYYDCSRFDNYAGTKYLITYALLEDRSEALEEMRYLRDNGFEGNVFWMGCFDNTETDYAVSIGTLYKNAERAQGTFKKIKRDMEVAGMLTDALSIEKLENNQRDNSN